MLKCYKCILKKKKILKTRYHRKKTKNNNNRQSSRIKTMKDEIEKRKSMRKKIQKIIIQANTGEIEKNPSL